MEKEEKTEETAVAASAAEEEVIELVLFQVSECYVYLIPPRKSAASYSSKIPNPTRLFVLALSQFYHNLQNSTTEVH